MRAMDYVCAIHAGMKLFLGNGEVEWIGTKTQWEEYYNAVAWVEENGSYPWYA